MFVHYMKIYVLHWNKLIERKENITKELKKEGLTGEFIENYTVQEIHSDKKLSNLTKIKENIISIFFWSSCPAFFNFKLLKISKKFLKKILKILSIIKKDITKIKTNKFLLSLKILN